MVGSLPDPINLVPFGGGTISAARLAGMTAKQTLARSARVGLVEGAAGNFASSAYAAYDLNPKGENLTAQDVLVDTMFGAIAGPLFHGGGAMLARAEARAGMRADIDLVVRSLPEDSPLRGQFGEYLAGMREGNARAYGDAADILGPDGVDALQALRKAATPEERMEIARAMEKALADMVDGQPVDVSPVLKDSPTITKDLGRKLKRVKVPEGRGFPSSEKIDAAASHLPVREFSALRDNDLSINLRAGEPAVNSAYAETPEAGGRVDWRPEPQPDTPPLPESVELDAAAETTITDPDAVTSEEAQAAVIAQERGRTAAEEAELKAVAEDRASIEKTEDASLKAAECAMEIL